MTVSFPLGREIKEILKSFEKAIIHEIVQVQDTYNVSRETASAIVYLRGRSRHTPKKETILISNDLQGNPISLSDVLLGIKP